MYCHGVLRHKSRKCEVNLEELDVLFDQFLEGNSCISLRITRILSYLLPFSSLYSSELGLKSIQCPRVFVDCLSQNDKGVAISSPYIIHL